MLTSSLVKVIQGRATQRPTKQPTNQPTAQFNQCTNTINGDWKFDLHCMRCPTHSIAMACNPHQLEIFYTKDFPFFHWPVFGVKRISHHWATYLARHVVPVIIMCIYVLCICTLCWSVALLSAVIRTYIYFWVTYKLRLYSYRNPYPLVW